MINDDYSMYFFFFKKKAVVIYHGKINHFFYNCSKNTEKNYSCT